MQQKSKNGCGNDQYQILDTGGFLGRRGIRLGSSCKKSAQIPYVFCPVSTMLTFCKGKIYYHNQQTDIHIIHQYYSGFYSVTCIPVCVCQILPTFILSRFAYPSSQSRYCKDLSVALYNPPTPLWTPSPVPKPCQPPTWPPLLNFCHLEIFYQYAMIWNWL